MAASERAIKSLKRVDGRWPSSRGRNEGYPIPAAIDMASSLPAGSSTPPPRRPSAPNPKRTGPGFRVRLAEVARGIPKSSVQSAALWAAGDLICQRLEKKDTVDMWRLAVNATYGAAILGPVGHLWYEGLDVFVKRRVSGGGARMVAAKLACDLAVFGPTHLACFLGWSGFWSNSEGNEGRPGGVTNKQQGQATRQQGNNKVGRGGDKSNKSEGNEMGGRWRAALSRARASIGEDFISGLVVDTGFWAPIQTLNFALVPVRRQLLFVNCACVVDAALLSWIASHPGELTRMWENAVGARKGT